jgi:hypothetical protein
MFSDELKVIADGIRARCVVDLANPEVMKKNLLFVYHSAVASSPLLWLAHKSTPTATEFERKLKQYFLNHWEEERDHERWLLNDLATAELDPRGDCDWIAAAMSGSLYYAINHWHPVALLGYMMFIETNPPPAALVDTLESIHGKELMRTLRYHAINDVDHSADLRALLDECPQEHRKLVTDTMAQTGLYYVAASRQMRGDSDGI